jgi:uncharacterized protein (DUF433 family)
MSIKPVENLNWQIYIHSDPKILVGKPVVKGTRLAVTFILQLLAAGCTEQQILESYPVLSADALRAIFAFAAECLQEEALYDFPQKVA